MKLFIDNWLVFLFFPVIAILTVGLVFGKIDINHVGMVGGGLITFVGGILTLMKTWKEIQKIK